MKIEYPTGGDTAALGKHATTSRKGASVPGSGDGAVKVRARQRHRVQRNTNPYNKIIALTFPEQ